MYNTHNLPNKKQYIYSLLFNVLTLYVILGTSQQERCQDYRITIANYMGNKIAQNVEEFNELQYGYQLIYNAKNSVQLKDEKLYKVSVVDTVKQTGTLLEAFYDDVTKRIKEDLNFDEIPPDLKKYINRNLKRSKITKAYYNEWIEIFIIDDSDVSRVGMILFGAKRDPCNSDNIILIVQGFREKWIDDGDALFDDMTKSSLKDKFREYLRYKIYMDLYDNMDINVRYKIDL